MRIWSAELSVLCAHCRDCGMDRYQPATKFTRFDIAATGPGDEALNSPPTNVNAGEADNPNVGLVPVMNSRPGTALAKRAPPLSRQSRCATLAVGALRRKTRRNHYMVMVMKLLYK